MIYRSRLDGELPWEDGMYDKTMFLASGETAM
jgi:hypothetical protein